MRLIPKWTTLSFLSLSQSWNCTYFCRIDSFSPFVSIEDQNNQSCLVNRSGNLPISSFTLRRFILDIGWHYNPDGTRSSVTFLPGSLTANRTYLFRADLVNRQDSSRLYTGYVTVGVQSTDSIEVSVGYVSSSSLHAIHCHRSSRCVLLELCPSIDAYRLINSDTQAAFTSLTSRNLSTNYSIQWRVYAGRMNSSIEWTLLENLTHHNGRWFFGRQTSSGL